MLPCSPLMTYDNKFSTEPIIYRYFLIKNNILHLRTNSVTFQLM